MTSYYLKQKGWRNVQIAEFTGHHRDTIARVLKEEINLKSKKWDRKSAASVFNAQIHEMAQQLPSSTIWRSRNHEPIFWPRFEPRVGPVLCELIAGRYSKGVTIIPSNKSFSGLG
jgi:hypothetical protein